MQKEQIMIDKEEVLKMGQGRRMDFLVAQEVIGETLETPHYSTNVCFAEKVLETIRDKYPTVLLGMTSWECKVFLPEKVVTSGLTESLSLAICRSALLTMIEEKVPDRI